MENSDYIIEVKNLKKSFKKNLAVDDINFKVKRGEVFAFLGPNGAGKSTTIKMLTTLLKPSEGKIIVNNFDVLKNKAEVRKSFGIVFQDQSLDSELSAYENMYFHAVLYKIPKKERQSSIKELLIMVDLWEKRKQVVKKFSGGMKRRLEIARGLLHHPKILFLDEPTLGLDPQTRQHIWQYIMNLNKQENLTIFFSTHYLDEVEKIADKVAIIDKGKIIEQGSVKEIKTRQNSQSLEEAFIKLTGNDLKNDEKSETFSRFRQTLRKG